MPAFPAAAALAARALFDRQPAGQGAWRSSAILATLLPAYVIVNPTARAWVRDYALAPIAVVGLAVLLVGVWAAPTIAKRSVPRALGAFAAGWTGFAVMAALVWPRIPPATDPHAICAAAAAARNAGATVVGFQAYLQGLPLALESPVPLADYVGELEPQFEPRPEVREALFWTREKFWSEWRSGQRYAALVRRRDLPEFGASSVPARVLASSPKQVLLANYRD